MLVDNSPTYQSIFWELACRALSPHFDGVVSEDKILCELCCGASGLLRYFAGYKLDSSVSSLGFCPQYVGIDSQFITPEATIKQWEEQDNSEKYLRRASSRNNFAQYENATSQNGTINGHPVAFHQANVLTADFLGPFDNDAVPRFDMTFCMIPTTTREERTTRNISDWNYIRAAIKATKKHGRVVIAAPIRTLKSAKINDIEDISHIWHIHSVTLLSEEITPHSNVKLALIVLEGRPGANLPTRFFNATRMFGSIFESTDAQKQFAIQNAGPTFTSAWIGETTDIPSIEIPRSPSLYPDYFFEGSDPGSGLQIGDLFLVRRGLSKSNVLKYAGPIEAQFVTATDLADGEYISDADEQPLRCEYNPLTKPTIHMVSNEARKFALPNGPTILLSRNGFPYKVAYISRCKKKVIIPADSIYIIEANGAQRENDLLLVFAYLASNAGQNRLKSLSRGSAISQLSPNAIRSITIPNIGPGREKILATIQNNREEFHRTYLALERLESERKNLFRDIESNLNAFNDSLSSSWNEPADGKSIFHELFESNTGLELLDTGMRTEKSRTGTTGGSTVRFAEYRVKDTRIVIEVVGFSKSKFKKSEPLLLRTDDIDEAITNKQDDVTFAHYCPSANLWRAVHINDAFLSQYKRGEFAYTSEATKESGFARKDRYIKIPAKDACVRPIEELFGYASSAKNGEISAKRTTGVKDTINLKPNDSKYKNRKHYQYYQPLLENDTFKRIDEFLTEGLELEATIRLLYIGYHSKIDNSKMLVKIKGMDKPISSRFTIRIPLSSFHDAEFKDLKPLGRYDGSKNELVIEDAKPDRADDILDILRQIG